MAQRVPLVSREQVALFTQNKSHLYAAMLSNGYVMPKPKSRCRDGFAFNSAEK